MIPAPSIELSQLGLCRFGPVSPSQGCCEIARTHVVAMVVAVPHLGYFPVRAQGDALVMDAPIQLEAFGFEPRNFRLKLLHALIAHGRQTLPPPSNRRPGRGRRG